MPIYLFIGLGAGVCAAVLFASAVLGQSALGIILLFVVPLPKFLAGLGWGWRAALIAAVTATLLVGVFANPLSGMVYGFSQGIPAVWLCYLAYLNRDVNAGSGSPAQIEWYPVGHLIAWSAGIAGALTAMTIYNLGSTTEALRQQMQKLVEMFRKALSQVDPQAANTLDVAAMADVMLKLVPATFAASALVGILFNLWLAARITRASGRLLRPWPDLAGIRLPSGAAMALALTVAVSLPGSWTGVPEYPRTILSGFSSALFLAYVLVGMAIVHSTTRGKSWRAIALFAFYAALVFLNPWSALAAALLALTEPFAPWRRPSAPPPPSPPPPGGPST